MKKDSRALFRHMQKAVLTTACVALPMLGLLTSSAIALPSSPLLQADRISFDENTNIITASGNVEVNMDDKMLRADRIAYDKNTDVVRAFGNVAVTESTGEVMYSDHVELTTDIKQGFIDRVKILFPDNSKLIANDAQRYDGRYLIAQKGIYTSCDLCKDDPTKAPLWQLKGARVTHDSVAKDVIYRDAVLEFAGIPVFYTPYFKHPDPSVMRRQGFLTPTAGANKTLGTFISAPYYVDIAPNSDLVVKPTFSTVDKIQLQTDWRHRFMQGDMNWSGSITKTDFTDETGDDRGKRIRGHLFGETRFDITNTWRAGTKVALTTDKSYLPRYDIAADDVLVNRAYAENFKGRNYAVGNMYYFQDLRPGDQLAEPLVAPELRYSALGEPGQAWGGRWAFNAGLLVTSRSRDINLNQQGASTRRLSFDAGWERQFTSETGFLMSVAVLTRADTYWADNVPDPNVMLGTGFSNIKRVRPFAQGDITVRYPLGRRGDGYQQLVEPIGQLFIAPRMSRKKVLPNEDSLDLEFDETNLFATNRFTGIDRIEGGTRTAYGLRHAIIGDNGARIDMLGGQIFRLNEDPAFTEGSGLRHRFSDYVGRVSIEPFDWLQANHGFRLDQEDLSFTRQEAQLILGTKRFRPSASYLYIKQDDTLESNQTLEEAAFGISSEFTKFWTISANHSQAMKPAPGPRATNVSLTYQDECFKTGVTARQDHTSRLDISAGRSILFHFYLKNIGGLSTD